MLDNTQRNPCGCNQVGCGTCGLSGATMAHPDLVQPHDGTGAMASAFFGTSAPAAVERVFGAGLKGDPPETFSVRDVQRIVAECRYSADGYELFTGTTPEGRLYLQVKMRQPCTKTGQVQDWSGRKWMLSPYMTKSEVVQTAFKAVLTAVEHEARERFLYKGRPIFGPHYDVDKLWVMATEANEEVRG